MARDEFYLGEYLFGTGGVAMKVSLKFNNLIEKHVYPIFLMSGITQFIRST